MHFDSHLQDGKNMSLKKDNHNLHDQYPGSSCKGRPFLRTFKS